MPKPRKTTEDQWYDIFAGWPLSDQKVAMKVLERLVIERERDEKRAVKTSAPSGDDAAPPAGGAA